MARLGGRSGYGVACTDWRHIGNTAGQTGVDATDTCTDSYSNHAAIEVDVVNPGSSRSAPLSYSNHERKATSITPISGNATIWVAVFADMGAMFQ